MDSINTHITKFSVFLDTNVLYKSHIRDLILRLSRKDTFKVYWSDGVLAELQKNLSNNAGLSEDKVVRLTQKLNEIFPDSCISGYEDFVESVVLSATEDKHVVAAALRAHCDMILTENVKDFPDTELSRYAIEAQNPDTFLCHHYSLEQGKTIRAIQEHISMLNNPPLTFAEYLGWLERAGAVVFAEKLKKDTIGDILNME